MYILGIYYGHNSTASIMRDGELLACASEERFNGKKNYLGFPKKSIEYVLSATGISSANLVAVTISHRYGVPMKFHTLSKHHGFASLSLISVLYYLLHPLRIVWGKVSNVFPSLSFIGRAFYRLLMRSVGRYTNWKERTYVARYLGISRDKIYAYDHHLSHAASSYYASPFNTKRVLVLTLDGEGDLLSGSVTIFEKEKFKTIIKIPRESSLGYLYGYVTVFLGMKPNEHEYKVMGLAPYANEDLVNEYYPLIEDLVSIDPRTLQITSKINMTDALQFLEKNFHKVRFDIVAGVFQKLLEKKILEWVQYAIKKTGVHTVVLSGGTFMNVKVNQRIAQSPFVNDVFIVPSCGDESSILGSSYLAYRELCSREKKPFVIPPLQNIYLGPSFRNEEIEAVLRKNKLFNKYTIKKMSHPEKYTAKLLAEGNIVARMAGRMEFGARALGNRSILADPRNLSVVRIINEQIKNRDFWMPFAASILKEREGDYIKNPKGIDGSYMMMTFDCTEKGRSELVAATHQYDFTTRPQIVRKDQNSAYHRIISEFEKLTGVGAILNTSFNLHGYPIVLGPKEALEAFAASGLKYLVLEDYLIIKKSDKKRMQ